MRYFLILCFILGYHLAVSQDGEVTLKLDDFKEVKGFDGIAIKLIKSTENKAVISGENTRKVAVVNNDGVLKIRMQIGKIFSGYRTFVTVYYKSKLLVIDVNEDARITSEGLIEQDVLELKAQEGGEIMVNAKVEQLLIKAVSGGVIQTVGTAKLQDVQINTGGIYEGKELKTKFSTINVNAGSKAEVYASDYVKVNVKAGGEVLLYGKPSSVDEKTVFGGNIRKM